MNIIEYVNLEKSRLKEEVKTFSRPPHLLIIQVNDDPASDAYIKGKMKDGEEIGVKVSHLKLNPLTSEETLVKEINLANDDKSIDGIIVHRT